MTMIKYLKYSTKEFLSQWTSYLILFFSINVMLSIVVTFFDIVISTVLLKQGVPFLSYTNLEVLIEKPVVLISLIILLLLLIYAIYFQFAYLLIGIKRIYQRQFNMWFVFKEAFLSLRYHALKSFPFFIFYFI